MKTGIYVNYASRSLIRGGQRTVLAIFCVAIGVMSVVSLQLVGKMINNAFTSNVRDANGGDLAVTSQTAPFSQNDLAFFAQLQSSGTITRYTPRASFLGSPGLATSLTGSFTVQVVDPGTFPLVTPPTFQNPSNGQFSTLLGNNQVVIDHNLADQFGKKVGDTFDLHINAQSRGGAVVHVTIAGIINDSGVFSQANDFLVLSTNDYQQAMAGSPLFYDTIDVATADKAHTDQAVQAIQTKFPIASLTTTDQALQNSQAQVGLIQKFLSLVGLLALLIGGVGIMNTMQVLLSRRRIEIATLKTTGYHRSDLALLFGLEAALLGLIGGLIGTAIAIGLSALVRVLVQQLFPVFIPFQLDPAIIAGGILIGFFTALTFGLMPIVKAARIRPLNVIRDEPDSHHISSAFLTIGLVLLLSVLFCIIASTILQDSIWGISAVYGALVFLGLLSLVFGLVVLLVSKLPVPERFNIKQGILVVLALVLAVFVALALPAFGILLLVFALLGIIVTFLPQTTKSSVRMALRNIGRRRARTTTTLLALFIGVFSIGLILVMGQDLTNQIDQTIANNLTFNTIVVTRGSDTATLAAHLSGIPGLSQSDQRQDTSVVPLSIDGVPLQNLVPKNASTGYGNLGAGVMYYLNGFEGYDVAHNQLPDTQRDFTLASGRNLNASDPGMHNMLLNDKLLTTLPLKGHVHLGSTITFGSLDGKTTTAFTVVGTFTSKGLIGSFDPILTTTDAVQALSPAGQTSHIFYMKIDPDKVGLAMNAIGKVTPGVAVLNLANISDYINKYIGDILVVLIAVASLSLLAGAITIANAVALAMLERRRELGILKSIGYTSQTVLGEVLIENGIIGATGATLAMLLVTLATSIVGQYVFKTNFGVSWYIALGLIAGIALLAMFAATLVAWQPVRIRPLMVLRYE